MGRLCVDGQSPTEGKGEEIEGILLGQKEHIFKLIRRLAMNQDRFSVMLYQNGRMLVRWDGLELKRAQEIYRVYFPDADYGLALCRNGERLKARAAWQLMGVDGSLCWFGGQESGWKWKEEVA
jgi:hypothetical protein